MELPAKQSHNNVLKRLLEEGARTYLEAATAIVTFQQEVQKRCREVMEGNLAEYASALKVVLRSTELEVVADPPFTKWEGDYWALGVRIVRTDLPKLRWWEMQCLLEYHVDGDWLGCSIAEWFPTSKIAAEVARKLNQINRDVYCDGKAVWLELAVKVEDASAFEEKLATLVQQWISVWSKVGGIKAVFKG